MPIMLLASIPAVGVMHQGPTLDGAGSVGEVWVGAAVGVVDERVGRPGAGGGLLRRAAVSGGGVEQGARLVKINGALTAFRRGHGMP